jgi:hypothetical protein
MAGAELNPVEVNGGDGVIPGVRIQPFLVSVLCWLIRIPSRPSARWRF